jgi:hypothetical protein
MPSKPPAVLVLCTAILVCAAGFLQWRSAIVRELERCKRQGKHFEQMFRDASDDSKEWEKKYKLVKTQLERVILLSVKSCSSVAIFSVSSFPPPSSSGPRSLASCSSLLGLPFPQSLYSTCFLSYHLLSATLSPFLLQRGQVTHKTRELETSKHLVSEQVQLKPLLLLLLPLLTYADNRCRYFRNWKPTEAPG